MNAILNKMSKVNFAQGQCRTSKVKFMTTNSVENLNIV